MPKNTLTKLSVTNFQKHKKLSIDFGSITTIIGKSGSGKTAIIRALNLLLFNKPQGIRYVTHGTDKCHLELELDGKKIERVRAKSKNYFLIDKKQFEAFGTTVPKEIQELLNINDINIQKQLDPPFWIHLSAGEISKKLNSIVNLEEIDTVTNFINIEVRRVQSELTLTGIS